MALLPTLESQPLRDRASMARDESADRELVRRLRRGDSAALDIVLQRHWGPIVAYLVRLLGSRDAAEDVAQRAFCRLWERRDSWQDDGSIRGLLYRMARNFAISDRRRSDAEARSAAVHAGRQGGIATPLGLLEDQQLREELDVAIQRLPPRRREVFVLRYIHDLSYREIAEIMETSPQTVANQLSSALTTLRGALRHLLD
jgi:RNA polymerase sigma-70 factor (ECF subfamily)